MNSTQVESSLTLKYNTRVWATENDKESSLLQYRINYIGKKLFKGKSVLQE